MNLVKCVYCGSDLKPILGVYKEYLNDHILAINNVPLVFCSECMEEYIPASTMEVIKNIVLYFSKDMNLKNEDTTIMIDYNDYIEKDIAIEM